MSDHPQSEAGQLTYRQFTIYYDPPPIPIRTMDYHYYHDDYDGEGDNRHGSAASIEACKAEIDDWHNEQETT